jgi:hypothetical protein
MAPKSATEESEHKVGKIGEWDLASKPAAAQYDAYRPKQELEGRPVSKAQGGYQRAELGSCDDIR